MKNSVSVLTNAKNHQKCFGIGVGVEIFENKALALRHTFIERQINTNRLDYGNTS